MSAVFYGVPPVGLISVMRTEVGLWGPWYTFPGAPLPASICWAIFTSVIVLVIIGLIGVSVH